MREQDPDYCKPIIPSPSSSMKRSINALHRRLSQKAERAQISARRKVIVTACKRVVLLEKAAHRMTIVYHSSIKFREIIRSTTFFFLCVMLILESITHAGYYAIFIDGSSFLCLGFNPLFLRLPPLLQ